MFHSPSTTWKIQKPINSYVIQKFLFIFPNFNQEINPIHQRLIEKNFKLQNI